MTCEPLSMNVLNFLWLEITSKCNLECVHCYSESSPRESLLGQMTTEDWLRVLTEAAALGCRQVQFIGGEPTLHPNLKELISFAASSGFSFIEIFTNATVLEDRLIANIKTNGANIATSFYSDEPAVHDSITHHPGSFDRTVSNIKKLVDAGISVRVGIIETVANAGQVDRAKVFLESIGVTEIRLDAQRQVGRGTQSLKIQNPLAELCGECAKGKLCVTASRQIFPCVFSRFVNLGDVDTGIASILQADALKVFCENLKTNAAKKNLRANLTLREGDHTQSEHAAACGPDIICTPDRQCTPNCVPGSSKCMPSLSPCLPSTRCLPHQRVLSETELSL